VPLESCKVQWSATIVILVVEILLILVEQLFKNTKMTMICSEMEGCGFALSACSCCDVISVSIVQEHLHSHLVAIAGSIVEGSEAIDVRSEGGAPSEVS
jgi:hypothetical protein